MLRITAIVATFNEADIIGQTVGDLVRQGIHVYVLDNHSTDGTTHALQPHLASGLVQTEQFPDGAIGGGGASRYEHARIMARKQQLALELDADWFISHDADEFRESPWLDLNLREGIERVDRSGYNAIDFSVLNFWPTHDRFDPAVDIRETFQHFEVGGPWDRAQVKCWKKAADVELVASGGHDALFASRRVFPIRFILRHYPIRSQAHGVRKVFAERKARFAEEDVQRGWHVQYDHISAGHQFIRDPATLTAYDPERVRIGLTLRHRGVEELEAALSLQHRRVDELDAALSLQHRRVNELEAALVLRRQEAGALETALRAAQRDTEALRNDLALQTKVVRDYSRERDARVRDLDECRRSIEGLSRGLDARIAETESLRHAVEQQSRQLRDLYDSKSWRLTRPLRAMYAAATGAPGVASATSIDVPAAATPLRWGDLARLTPLSQVWGTDRGLPVDRHYIHRFLAQSSADIQGRVLEVKDAHYARIFGSSQLLDVDVLDLDSTNPHATLTADLSCAEELPGNQFDCFILTQTVHIIYDIKGALRHAARLLKPGGVLLCTIPAVSRVNYENGGLENGDFWRLTRAAVLRLFAEVFEAQDVRVATYGNVRVCTAFLYGLATEDLDPSDLAFDDPWFPLIHCIRAVRSSSEQH